MKRFLIALAVVVVVGGGVFAVYVLSKDKDNNMNDMQHQQSAESSSADQSAPAEAQSGQVAVSISDFKYQPQNLKVKKGTVVTWTNQDDVQHDVVSDSDSPQRGLNSELLSKGASYSFTFDEVGKYTYHCRPHPYMTGTVEVVE